jgi:hypothetical protein
MFRRPLAVLSALALTGVALTAPAVADTTHTALAVTDTARTSHTVTDTARTAHADRTYRGDGDQVLRIRTTKAPGLIALTHNGEANFIVWTVTPAGKKDSLLVNEIGPYKGTVLYNDRAGKGVAALEIKADGPWTAVFKPISKARCWCSATIRGAGDQVLKLSPTRGLRTARATHRGDGNFIVWSHTRVGEWGDLLFNQLDDYRGKALLPTGTRLIKITADGDWTLVRN